MVTSQVTLPAPRTWTPGDLVTVPRLRADLSDAAALLLQRPYFVAQQTTGEPITTANAVTVTLDTTLADTWAGYVNPASNVYRCQLPGWYLLDARIPFAYTSATAAPLMAGFSSSETNSGATVYGALTVNGSTSGSIIARSVDLVQMLYAGSTSGTVTSVLARQDSGGTVNLATGAGNLPTVAMRWVCANAGTQPLPLPPLAAVPSPITAAWLNANLRDTVRFLTYPPVAKAHYVAGTAALANSSLASPQVVPLSTADVDTYGAMATGASAQYAAPVAGRYLLAGTVNLAASSTSTYYAAGVRVNGSTVYWGRVAQFAGTSLAGGAAVAKRLRLAAGDTVQLVAAQASGGAIAYNATASNQTRLIAVWEGI